MASPLNRALIGLVRRAEQNDAALLVKSFVDVGALFTLLSGPDHQVLYGRRGTGKTHALTYLAASRRDRGDAAVFIDLRTIGSVGGIYMDPAVDLGERATRLTKDVATAIYESLLDDAIEQNARDAALAHLEAFADEIRDVEVYGGGVERHVVEKTDDVTSSNAHAKAGFRLNPFGGGLDVGAGGGRTTSAGDSYEQRTVQHGTLRAHVRFGALSVHLRRLAAELGGGRVWILLDEWSNVPLDLQPFLAEFIKRALLPVPGVTVKIAAIPQRSVFTLDAGPGVSIGIELGADVNADLDLDDFMVFGRDPDKAKAFFQVLIFRHVVSAEAVRPLPSTSDELIQRAFTQQPAFDELVRAAEGVARDAINILSLAAQRADEAQIAKDHVRTAARDWYLRDKESAVAGAEARALLHWITDEVIGTRNARSFLLRQTPQVPSLIATLYDARVLHIAKRGVSSRDEPGTRYDAWQLDYGCYVELIATSKNPRGLFLAADDDGAEVWADVPRDDYRSIRRAILELDAFLNRQGEQLVLGGPAPG